MPERMSGEAYKELKKVPEVKEYRDALARSLWLAKKYDGTEAQHDELFRALEEFEEIIQTTPGLNETQTRSREVESALKFAPIHPREINELLEIAIQSRQEMIHKAAESEELSPLYIKKVKGVLLPPSDEYHVERGTGVGKIEAPRFEERLQELLGILEEVGILQTTLSVPLARCLRT